MCHEPGCLLLQLVLVWWAANCVRLTTSQQALCVGPMMFDALNFSTVPLLQANGALLEVLAQVACSITNMEGKIEAVDQPFNVTITHVRLANIG